MEECIFCKIINGESPAEKIYETESVLVFTPKGQVNKGHILVVPKKHYENIFDIPNDSLHEVVDIAKEMALKYQKSFGATGVNLLQASGKDAEQSVFHFHMHVVPRYQNDGLDLWFKADIERK